MLVRHSLLYVMVRVLAGTLGMATTAALTRILSPGTYGTYSVALVIMSIGAAVAFEWLGVAFMRFYQARRGDPRTMATFVYLFIMIVLVTAVGGGILLISGVIPEDMRLVVLAGMLLLWSYSCFELLARVEIVKFEPRRYLWMNLMRGGLTFFSAVIAAWLTHSALWTAVGMSIGMAAGAIGGTSIDFKSALRSFDRALAFEILWFGLPLAASAILTGLGTIGARALVGALDSTEALGIYTASFFLVQNTLTILSSGLAQAGYSLAVRAVESGDTQATRHQLAANGTILIAVMAPACLGMALISKGVAATLVGARFADGVAIVTPWMAAATFFSVLRFHYLDHAFQLGKRPNLLAAIAGVAAILSLILTTILVPHEGPVGAAMAITVTMALSCVHASIAGKQAFAMPIPWLSIGKVMICCALMAAAVLSLHGPGLARMVAQIAFGATVYGGVAVALNLLDVRDHIIRMLQKTNRLAAWSSKSS